mgnify:CR=1 FL=1
MRALDRRIEQDGSARVLVEVKVQLARAKREHDETEEATKASTKALQAATARATTHLEPWLTWGTHVSSSSSTDLRRRMWW